MDAPQDVAPVVRGVWHEYLNGRRVAETMSHKITAMNHGQGFTANLLIGIIVIGASRLGMPVSTTHVSCGTLLGIGTVTGSANRKVILSIFGAWIITLPLGAILGSLTWTLLGLQVRCVVQEASVFPAVKFGGDSMSLAVKEHLLVFARMPEPGNTKTRLIPACGAEAAAAISMFLTQKTIQTANRFAASRGCKITIHSSGGDPQSMAEAFGAESKYVRQLGSSLGSRLVHATEHAFSTGASRVVVIGTDCLELEERDLSLAFDSLRKNEVVLGPATDGGYYLIGLNHFQPLVFHQIDWGSEFVLAQTKAIAKQCASSIAELRYLADIDHPEDMLPLRSRDCLDGSGLFNTVHGRLSVIIPTLNEADQLHRTLCSIGQLANKLEVIVVDGGSTDNTVSIAKEHGCRTFVGNRGRARQLNAGAAAATGEYLLFLHADTHLPEGYVDSIIDNISSGNIACAFRLGICGVNVGLRMVEWGANTRSRFLRLPCGDQGISMRSSTFYLLGGYKNLPIMEDYELARRLRRIGNIGLLEQTVTTSGRRWHERGLVTTTIVNQLCILAYKIGVSPAAILSLYRRDERCQSN